MEEVGGVVAPEDLVGAGDHFSGQHLPLAAVAAHIHPPGGIDLLARSGAELHEGHAISAHQQFGVALIINGGVVIKDRANHRSCGANAVSRACGKGEGNGFIGLNLNISRGIDCDVGGGGSSGKGDRLGGGCGGDTGVIGTKAGGADHGVVHRETTAGIASSEKGVNQIGRTIFCDGGWRYRQADHGSGGGGRVCSIDDIKGCLNDAAGVEEGTPVGVAAFFVKHVACCVFQMNGVENPGASGCKGIKVLRDIESTS